MLEGLKKVFGGGNASSNVESKREKVTTYEGKVETDTTNCDTSENELVSFEEDKGTADEKLKTEEGTLESAQTKLGDAQTALETAQNTPVEIITNEDGTTKEDTTKRDEAVEAAQKMLDEAKEDVENAQKNKDTAQEDVDKIAKDIENTQKELDGLKTTKETDEGELDSAKTELSEAEKQAATEEEQKTEGENGENKELGIMEKNDITGFKTFEEMLDENGLGSFTTFNSPIGKDITEEDIAKLAESAKTVINSDKYSKEELEEAKNNINTANFTFYNLDEDEEAKDYIKLAKDAQEYLRNGNPELAQEIKDDIKTASRNLNLKKGVAPETIKAVEAAYNEIGVGEDKGDNRGEMEKYGGAPGDAWCASFVSWAYGEAQKTDNKDTFGYEIAVRYLRADAEKAGYYSKKEDYEPVTGDIVIQENNASHTGIVVKTDDKYIYTIEGNAGDKVRAKKYARDGQAINKTSGYIRMNEWKGSKAKPIGIDYLSFNEFEDADKDLKQSTL